MHHYKYATTLSCSLQVFEYRYLSNSRLVDFTMTKCRIRLGQSCSSGFLGAWLQFVVARPQKYVRLLLLKVEAFMTL